MSDESEPTLTVLGSRPPSTHVWTDEERNILERFLPVPPDTENHQAPGAIEMIRLTDSLPELAGKLEALVALHQADRTLALHSRYHWEDGARQGEDFHLDVVIRGHEVSPYSTFVARDILPPVDWANAYEVIDYHDSAELCKHQGRALAMDRLYKRSGTTLEQSRWVLTNEDASVNELIDQVSKLIDIEREMGEVRTEIWLRSHLRVFRAIWGFVTRTLQLHMEGTHRLLDVIQRCKEVFVAHEDQLLAQSAQVRARLGNVASDDPRFDQPIILDDPYQKAHGFWPYLTPGPSTCGSPQSNNVDDDEAVESLILHDPHRDTRGVTPFAIPRPSTSGNPQSHIEDPQDDEDDDDDAPVNQATASIKTASTATSQNDVLVVSKRTDRDSKKRKRKRRKRSSKGE